MKLVKKLFYLIAVLLILLCAGVMLCAFQPELTAKLAHLLYGQNGIADNIDNAIDKLDGVKDLFGENQNQGLVVEIPELGIHVGTQDGIDWNKLPENGYEMADSQTLVLPDNVVGKSDTLQISQEAKEVEADEEKLLEDALDKGNLGEELTFAPEFYPYYAMLTEDMKRLYCQIYANATEVVDSFAPAINVHVSQLKTVFEAVYNDHPELFYVDTGYSCKYTQSGQVVEISLKYNKTAERLQEETRRFQAAAESILEETRKFADDLEKERYVHTALAELVEYKTTAECNQSAYSALVNHQSVCAGYARAFQYLMQKLEIPTYYCTGYSDGDHAWNIIALEDRYANVDVTWDDTEPLTFDYYNCSDEAFRSTHLRTGLSVYLPACLEEEGTTSDTELVTPLPQEPLEYEPESVPPKEEEEDGSMSYEDQLVSAGLTADQVVTTLDAYYKQCLEKTKALGLGSHTYEIIIPVSLYPAIEAGYLDETYKKAYADTALESIGAQNFAIQMQVARWNGTYFYKLYHCISVWN